MALTHHFFPRLFMFFFINEVTNIKFIRYFLSYSVFKWRKMDSYIINKGKKKKIKKKEALYLTKDLVFVV